MIRLGIIFGGRSSEHEISLMSAASVIQALNKEKFRPVTIGITKRGKWLLYEGPVEKIESGQWESEAKPFSIDEIKQHIDFALPILHGAYGEDGTIQGMFEMLDIPYGGCGVLASAAAMDKGMAREIFIKNGLPMCKHILVVAEELKDSKKAETIYRRVVEELGFPVFVKPANMGSSVGITKVNNSAELPEALKLAAKLDRRVVIEAGVNCRELETGVIGNDELEIATVGEILPSAEFYDYKAKYFDGGKTQICVPADITDEQRECIRNMAEKAYRALDCNGFARVDFFMDKDTKEIYLNEINTIPGFTKFSMFALLFKEVGVNYGALIERIVDFGYERYNAKNSR